MEFPLIQKFDEAPIHASEFTCNWEPERFVFDFRNVTPQFGPQGPQVFAAHKVVELDPWLAKQFAEHCSKAVADYEQKFGKIAQSKAREQAHQEMHTMQSSSSKKPDYYG